MKKDIRNKIDIIDKRIIKDISLRFKLIEKIAQFKNKNNIYDKKREEQIFKNIKKEAKKYNLNQKFVTNIYNLILKESKKDLKNILNK